MGSAKFETNDADLIRTIKDSVAVERIDPQPGEVFSRPLHLVPERPDKALVPTLRLSSLQGVVDYIKEGIDDEARSRTFVHVISPTEVHVVCGVPVRDDRRWSPVQAVVKPNDSDLLSENFVSQADAIIELQSCFVESDRRAELIKILGTISREDGINQEDDGATQSVTLRSGVKAGEAKIENPYELAPFRTFPDITQPERPFIVRLDSALRVGIFCADGGMWENTARTSIKEFLNKALGDDHKVPILA